MTMPLMERTVQGMQGVLPGAERSAHQAAAARESAGHGRIKARMPQRDPGPLFEVERQEPGLFDGR